MGVCGNCFSIQAGESCQKCGFNMSEQTKKYPLALKPGSILNGRYIVGRVLGQGGFGITYLAQNDKTKERIAIKEFFPWDNVGRGAEGVTVCAHSGDNNTYFEHGKKLFLEEAKTLSEFMGNKNIVQVYSYFEENNTAYFAMEYIEGVKLGTYAADAGGILEPETAIRLLLPAMTALDLVHSKGVVHRDLAPDNIIVAKDGTVKVIDFGAARYSTGLVSKTLDRVNKPGFSPKEQYLIKGKQGPFTDVYAMAATLYYVITGKIPPESIARMDEDELIVPSALGFRMPGNSETVLLKAMEVNAVDRYQTMNEFKSALKAELPELRHSPAPSPNPEPQSEHKSGVSSEVKFAVNSLVEQADLAYSSEKYEQALNYLSCAIGLDKENPDIYNRLGRTYRVMGRYTEARENYEMALKYAPGDVAAIGNLGSLAYSQNDFDSALKFLNYAYSNLSKLSASGDRANITANYAVVVGKTGNKHEALRLLEEALCLGYRYSSYENAKAIINEEGRGQSKPKPKPEIKALVIAIAMCLVALLAGNMLLDSPFSYYKLFEMSEMHDRKNNISGKSNQTAIPYSTPTPTSPNAEEKIIKKLEGGFNPKKINLRHDDKNRFFEIDTSIYKCTGLTVGLKVSSYEGSVFGNWILYARNIHGEWDAITVFRIEDNIKLNEYMWYPLEFNEPKSFDALALVRSADVDYSINYEMELINAYVE